MKNIPARKTEIDTTTRRIWPLRQLIELASDLAMEHLSRLTPSMSSLTQQFIWVDCKKILKKTKAPALRFTFNALKIT